MLTGRVVVIVDNDEGVSRLLTIDDSGVTESPAGGDLDSVAGELAAQDPDMILVNRDAMAEPDDGLVEALNRRAPFRPGYAWRVVPGELPA